MVTASAAVPAQESRPAPRFRALRRLLRKKLALLAIVYIVVFYAAGIFAPLLAPHDPNSPVLERAFEGPSAAHWLGTDSLGRDLLSRVLYSARTTVIFTAAVVLTGGILLGLGLGLLAGYRGGWVDTAVMRVGEVLAGLPTLLLMLAIAAAFRTRINDLSFWLEDHTPLGGDAGTLVEFLIIVGAAVPFAWIGSSRIVRSQVLAIREAEYVVAAEATGAATGRILWRHVFPGVVPVFLVGLSGGMAAIAGAEVTLSFLGLGIDPPAASFGSLIADAGGTRAFDANRHVLLGSAIPLVLFFFAWNLLGDALVDLTQPQSARY